jgi:hypothetical protein
MQMTGSNGILSVPSEHLPGLIALVVVLPVLWLVLSSLQALASRSRAADALVHRLDGLGVTAKGVLFASVVGATVHAAIVPTHWGDERVTAILFIVDTIGFVAVGWWTVTQRRHWRAASVLMLGGTAGAYILYVLRGWETMDLVGLVTTTVELAAALVALSPIAWVRQSITRERWLTVAAVPVAMVTLLGTAAIAGATSTAASAAPASATTAGQSGSSPAGSMPGMGTSAPTATAPLSLPTTSPAGPIDWPDDMTTMAPGMEMATPGCTAQPTSAQQHAAVALVDQTVRAAAPYESLAAAEAAGYVPVTRTGQAIVHYINPAIYRQGKELDPSSIPVLVYVNTPHGAVLSAAMYLMPRSGGDSNPPQPGGCLTQWHIHTDLCFSGGTVVGNDNGGGCSAGSTNQVTQPMMHVWLTPVTGGPLAPDPPARSEVQSARQMPPLAQPNGTA